MQKRKVYKQFFTGNTEHANRKGMKYNEMKEKNLQQPCWWLKRVSETKLTTWKKAKKIMKPKKSKNVFFCLKLKILKHSPKCKIPKEPGWSGEGHFETLPNWSYTDLSWPHEARSMPSWHLDRRWICIVKISNSPFSEIGGQLETELKTLDTPFFYQFRFQLKDLTLLTIQLASVFYGTIFQVI